MISLFPTLKLSYFTRQPMTKSCLPFPLRQEPLRYYYFARNGIWEAFRVFGLKSGDEALMPAFTSGIEVDVATAYGLTPVFYNLKENLSPDLNDAAAKLSQRTKLFYLTYYLGFPQPLTDIATFCHTHRLWLFEDAALGYLSADERNVPLGSTGDAAIFCPRKTIPLPHCGILVLNNPKLHAPSSKQTYPPRLSTLRQLGSLTLKSLTVSHDGSWVGRFSQGFMKHGIPAAKRILSRMEIEHTDSGSFSFDVAKTDLGMSKISHYLLERFDYAAIMECRRKNYAALAALLADHRGITIVFPILPPYTCPLDMMILVRRRDEVIASLAREGIEASILWPEARTREVGEPFPFIKKLIDEHIVLPIHQDLNPLHMEQIATSLKQIVSP